MDEPVLEKAVAEVQTLPTAEIWERLDPATRERVIDLFAHLTYKVVVSQHGVKNKELNDVTRGHDKESNR